MIDNDNQKVVLRSLFIGLKYSCHPVKVIIQSRKSENRFESKINKNIHPTRNTTFLANFLFQIKSVVSLKSQSTTISHEVLKNHHFLFMLILKKINTINNNAIKIQVDKTVFEIQKCIQNKSNEKL